jgi:signal transduction histidine kinase
VPTTQKPGRRLVERRPWSVVTGASLLLVAVYVALPAGGATQTVYHDGLAIVATALLAARLIRDRLAVTRPWLWLGLAATLYAGVSPWWGTIPVLTGRELPYPSWVDGVYFLSYLFAGAFLVSLIRLRHRDVPDVRHAGTVALIDAAILALAVTAVAWPASRALVPADTSVTSLEQAVAIGYLLLPAGLFGLAARLITDDLRASTVHWLVLVWIGGELAGDLVYGLLAASGSFAYGHPIGALWIVSYVGLGALALHPRLGTLTSGTAERRLTGWRVWFVATAVLVPAMVLIVRPSTSIAWIAAAAIVGGLVRLRILATDLAEQQHLHRRLQRSNAELEEANQRLEHFASIASHDLRTPIANTHGLLETLTQRSATSLHPQDRELLERALANTAGMLQTLEALLTLARTREATVAVQAVDLGAVVDEVTAQLGAELDAAGADIRRGDLPVVSADPELIRILVQNLLANAARHRDPARPLEVTVEAVRVHGDWEIAVEDNGPGIHPDDRERIFDLFARSGDGRRVDGAGIGLATCKRIAQLHGGSIRAEPRSPGTRFVVRLPDRASTG